MTLMDTFITRKKKIEVLTKIVAFVLSLLILLGVKITYYEYM
jgi:hypothetical protein